MSASSWVVVVCAGSLIAIVLGILGTLPVWAGGGGRRLVPALLTAQAGAVLVVGTVLAAAAVRSWQLLDRPSEKVAHTLITVSRIDGDGRMYALIVLAVVALAALSAFLLFLSARFAAGADPTERTVACAVLGLEIGLCGYGLALCLTGSRSPVALVAVLNLPLAMAALVSCWPPHGLDPAAGPRGLDAP